ncbi:MAG: PilZ domain-containing protein, partial [Bdellovibrionota bacterium]
MSWLKKVFGSIAGEPEKRSFPARHSRVSLGPLHRVSFAPLTSDEKLQLGNISQGGMLLIDPGPIASAGANLVGQLTIEHDTFPIEGRFRHTSDTRAGVEFVKPGKELVSAIERYLRLEFLAMKLRRVDDMYLKPDPRGRVVWLTDGKQNEIYAVVGGRGLVSFHLTFVGHHIHATHDSGILVGAVDEGDSAENTNPGHKGSAFIVQETVAPKEVLRLALVFA